LALIEVQGYAIAALRCASVLLRRLGESEDASKASLCADSLLHVLESGFWIPELEYYAMGQDSSGKLIEAKGSNPGHLLFSKSIGRSRASAVTRQLMSPSFFSGWGIRTLASEETGFDPGSYHRGSIWPHDNAMIASGMAFYGFPNESALVLKALWEASFHIDDFRLTELFGGQTRKQGEGPVPYPDACSPQAWASVSPFLTLSALLGLKPDAERKHLTLAHPYLPDFLPYLELRGLRIADSSINLRFERQLNQTNCSVSEVHGDLSVRVANT
jgi:glycogen debranching enzyme